MGHWPQDELPRNSKAVITGQIFLRLGRRRARLLPRIKRLPVMKPSLLYTLPLKLTINFILSLILNNQPVCRHNSITLIIITRIIIKGITSQIIEQMLNNNIINFTGTTLPSFAHSLRPPALIIYRQTEIITKATAIFTVKTLLVIGWWFLLEDFLLSLQSIHSTCHHLLQRQSDYPHPHQTPPHPSEEVYLRPNGTHHHLLLIMLMIVIIFLLILLLPHVLLVWSPQDTRVTLVNVLVMPWRLLPLLVAVVMIV